MRLHRAGREYVRFPLDDLPTPPPPLEVQFDNGGPWYPLTLSGTTEASVLVAGPDATDNPAGTAVLSSGRHLPLVRAVDNPEIIIRGSGAIDVVDYL